MNCIFCFQYQKWTFELKLSRQHGLRSLEQLLICWWRSCDVIKSSRAATQWTLRWDCFVKCCFQSQEWTLKLKMDKKNPLKCPESTFPWRLSKFSSPEDHVIWLKAPEQPLNGPWGEIYFGISLLFLLTIFGQLWYWLLLVFLCHFTQLSNILYYF